MIRSEASDSDGINASTIGYQNGQLGKTQHGNFHSFDLVSSKSSGKIRIDLETVDPNVT